MFVRMIRVAAVLVSVMAGPLWAEDVALVLGNAQYSGLPDVAGGGDVVSAAGALRDADVAVVAGQNVGLDELRSLTAQFEQMAPAADALLVVLAGRFAHSGLDTFFLPVDSDGPGLSAVPGQSLPLSSVMTLLADVPGRAVLMLASDGDEGDMGRYLQGGIGDVTLPQGVTLVRTTPDAAAVILRRTLSRPGGDLAAMVRNTRAARGDGFLPAGFSFLESDGSGDTAAVAALQSELDRQSAAREQAELRAAGAFSAAERAERALWDAMRGIDDQASYRRYLEAFPQGRFADTARGMLGDIRDDPFRDARREEAALSLTRDQRQQVQRNLSALGFNTRGIDGIFGQGTRNAIRGWQTDRRLEVSGFLNAGQLSRLSREAGAQADQLRAEEAARQAEIERRDRALWNELGQGGSEAGLREYLDRFPDGVFAARARTRLSEIEAAREPQVDRRQRLAWEQARQKNTVAGYRRYLESYPQGAFDADARARIAALQRDDEGRAAAEAGENALGLNPLTRRAVEARLESMGLNPGPVDGQFDQDTRRAIRQYQRNAGLSVTGYLSEATVVRLLADSVRNFLR